MQYSKPNFHSTYLLKILFKTNVLNCFYKTRKEACELINEKFLKDNYKKLSIKLNTDVIKELEKLVDERGDDNGTLYDNNSNID